MFIHLFLFTFPSVIFNISFSHFCLPVFSPFWSATPPYLATNENQYVDEQSTFSYRRYGSLLNHILLMYYVINNVTLATLANIPYSGKFSRGNIFVDFVASTKPQIFYPQTLMSMHA